MTTTAGRIEVIAGGMFSGKSTELNRRLERSRIAGRGAALFTPSTDTRETRHIPGGHCIPADDPTEALTITLTTNVIGFDEAQFFAPDPLVDTVGHLADWGCRVIVAGLDMDFRGAPFGAMPALMAIADDVTKLHAVCVQCGADALYSDRLADGTEQTLIGDAESYRALCRACFVAAHSVHQEASDESAFADVLRSARG